jgi:protein-disulfide isomerase
MAQKKDSVKSTREKAAEARAAAQAAERRRERMIRIVGGLAVLAVVAGIISIGVLQSNKNSAGPSADAPLPAGVTSDNGYAWQVNTADAPSVQIYEDFQCPACGNLEQAYGALIEELAGQGEIELNYHQMTFLDKNLNTDHSVRAAGAFGCAIDAGAGQAYHNTVFANQPATEGDGWTDDQLKQFGADAGITGDVKTTFDKCVDDGTYQDWAELSTKAAFDEGVSGTPTIFVDGEELPKDAFADAETFTQALTQSEK